MSVYPLNIPGSVISLLKGCCTLLDTVKTSQLLTREQLPEVLEVVADVDDVLLGVVVAPEHAQQALLRLLVATLLNTETEHNIRA